LYTTTKESRDFENCSLFRASILAWRNLPVLDFDIRHADRISNALHRAATNRQRGSTDIPGAGPFMCGHIALESRF
jgi:hypothetical protein